MGLAVGFPTNVQDPELTGGYFEGDMVLSNDRNGLINSAARWPDKTVYFKIDDAIGKAFNH